MFIHSRINMPKSSRLFVLGVLLFIGGLLVVFLSRPNAAAAAPTFTVNALDDVADGSCDSGHCSLRDAIAAANANGDIEDVIEFSVSGTILLQNALQITADNLTITAVPGSILLTKALGAGDFNAIEIVNSHSHTLHGLSITGMTGSGMVAGNGIYISSTSDINGSQNWIEYAHIYDNQQDGMYTRLGRATNFIVYSTVENNGRYGVFATNRLLYSTVVAEVNLINNAAGAVRAEHSTMWAVGNDITNHPVVFDQDNTVRSHPFITYANNVDDFDTAFALTGPRYAFFENNWWTNGNTTGLTSEEWDERLGAPVVSWLDGWGDVFLPDGASITNPTTVNPAYPARNVSVAMSHGRNAYPFGNTTLGVSANMCSDYYDFAIVHADRSSQPLDNWAVSIPIDDNTACNNQVRDQKLLYRVTDIDNCANPTDTACWEPVPPAQVQIQGQSLVVEGLTAAELEVGLFVAGTTNGPQPTPTNTPVPTATNTPAPTATNTPQPTATNTPLPTATNTPGPTATNTPVPTATNTPLPTATNTPQPTATNTPLPTATNTPGPTATNTPVPTATNTPVPTATNTPPSTGDVIIYASNSYGNREIMAMNLTQNTAQIVDYLSIGTQAMDQDHTTGYVYFFEDGSDADEFGYWDPATGATTIVRQYAGGTGFYVKRMAFAPDGTLYIMDGRDRLYILDKITGDYTRLGRVRDLESGPYGGTGDFAFAPDGTLYLATYRSLYTVDIDNMRANLLYTDMIQVPDPNVPGAVLWTGLAYCDGYLYGADIKEVTGLSALIRIDPQTGTETFLYDTGIVVNDLTSCPATTTPVPTATNIPLPTATNTPQPTATNTPAPTGEVGIYIPLITMGAFN